MINPNSSIARTYETVANGVTYTVTEYANGQLTATPKEQPSQFLLPGTAPTQIYSQPIAPQTQPQQTAITYAQPQPLAQSPQPTAPVHHHYYQQPMHTPEPKRDLGVLMVWGAVAVGVGILLYLIGAAITKPTPVPVAVEPKPFYERTCHASGFLGLGQDCREREGYR